jgi:molecular chaperone DnaK
MYRVSPRFASAGLFPCLRRMAIMPAMAPVVGIDLGTTNSCVAVIEAGKPLVIPVHEGSLTMPSVVGFAGAQTLVGEPAKRQFINNVENTVFAAKRLLGRNFNDTQTQKLIATLTYRCIGGPNGDVWVVTGDRRRAVQEVSALVLAELREACRRHLAQDVTQAVIAVPAYFNDRQRHATKQAAKIAGLEVLRVINEPTAAALAFGLHQGGERKVAVYDLGGGTFDVSVLKVGGGAIEVLASAGDAFLGGHDFDQRIFAWMKDRLAAERGLEASGDPRLVHRLWEAAEAAKIRLSTESSVKVALPFLANDDSGNAIHFDCELERSAYEALVADLVDRTLTLFGDTIAAAKLTPRDLDTVLLVGGMTRTPRVRERVQQLTNCEPAAGIHPDLVVAVGAAVQAAMLTDTATPAVLLDVTPHNLGVLTVAGLAETMIPKNARVPTQAQRRFTTVSDDQEVVRIVVYQGDSRRIDKNEILGEFLLEGLRRAPRGQVQIDVSFTISSDGIVHVSAADVETGKAQTIRITGAVGLSEHELSEITLASPAGGR